MKKEDLLSPNLLRLTEYQCSFIKGLMNVVVGKLSQSQLRSRVEFVRHSDRLTQLFADKTLEIKSCFSVADGCLQVAYEKKAEALRSNQKTKMCINSSVTALARIELDKALRMLQANGCSLVYSDTGKFLRKFFTRYSTFQAIFEIIQLRYF